ncbi:MAG TPA: serine/threonine protein kinase, partial [Planctomycetes bacterium]|nr:serine/threonine protein kinase [Planctomycetota bacterium]
MATELPFPSDALHGDQLRGDRGETFRILGKLGAGGMGSVWRAQDLSAGREVALKACHADGAAQRRRFEREGQLAAALEHPGIVRVYSAGTIGVKPYLCYELVEGARTLGEAFRELGRDERLRLLIEAAQAVGHAHRQGVVHRDIKPEN